MPIFEYKCPDCKTIEERYIPTSPTYREANPQCVKHNDNVLHIMQRVEFSVPAKRAAYHGEQT